MLTILQVVPELVSGGVERTTLDVAHAIKQAGGRALVASRGGWMAAELASCGAELIEGPFDSKNPLTIYANAGRLAQIIRAERVDIVHARSRAPAWSAKWATMRTETKFVTTYAGIHVAKSAVKRWYNSVMASGDIVIANSSFTAQHIRDTYKDLRKPIAVIPRGIDLVRFDPARVTTSDVQRIRAKWGVRLEDRILFLPGRISRRKGIMDFITAIAMLQERNVIGVIAGNTGEKDDVLKEAMDEATKLGLSGRVRYVGAVEDMPVAYAASDIAISASVEPESFGRIAVEAQAMRTLVISTDLGGARETILGGQTGWLIPAEDPRALAQAISEALHLEGLKLEDMRDRGRANVVKKYDLNTMCRATLQVYAKLMSGSAPRRLRAAE